MAENKWVSGVINLLTGVLLMGLVIEWAQKMVGRPSGFLLGIFAYFQGRAVSFRECIYIGDSEILNTLAETDKRSFSMLFPPKGLEDAPFPSFSMQIS